MFVIEWRFAEGHPWSHLAWGVTPNAFPTEGQAKHALQKYLKNKSALLSPGWPACEYRTAPKGDTVIAPPKIEQRPEARNHSMEGHVDSILDVLNDLLAADENAISSLVEHRVAANEALADHPTAQVVVCDYGPRIGPSIGLLGVLNAIVGADEDGYGYICAEYEGLRVKRFARTRPPKMG